MSLQAMTLVLDFAPEHWSSGRRMVALAIADRVGQDGTTWCSVADVGKRSGLHERMVRYHIKALIQEGVLMKEKRHRDNGSQRSNLWIWVWTVPMGVQPTAPTGRQPTAPPH